MRHPVVIFLIQFINEYIHITRSLGNYKAIEIVVCISAPKHAIVSWKKEEKMKSVA